MFYLLWCLVVVAGIYILLRDRSMRDSIWLYVMIAWGVLEVGIMFFQYAQ